jgi:penicillin-binding protein 2
MVVKYKFRLYLFSLLVMAGFVSLVFRLHYLQIQRHDEFVTRVPGERKLRARVPGVRGEIKDRNGIVLAANKASFEVRVNLYDVVEEKKRQERQKQGKNFALPKREFEEKDGGFLRQKSETDIVSIFEELVVQPLKHMGLARGDYDEDEKKKLRIHYRTNPGGAVPWVYRTDLTFEEFSRFAENNLQLPGVFPEVRPMRHYLYEALACHIMGYVRLPDESLATKEERDQWDYFVGDDFGFTGVEKTMDKYLRGVPGVRVMRRNEKGAYVGEIEEEYVPPKKGNDVHLTLDARIQMIAERTLRESGIGRGAVVVIEPDSGEVLAMASVPNFDPNKFVPQIDDDDWADIRNNLVNPLMNRAVSRYVPGSIYKVPIALAGCAANKQGMSVNCSGGRNYAGTSMSCMGTHGTLNLTNGIMRSCNCYFFDLGNAAGIETIGRIGDILGLGRNTGIELEDESAGILPSRQWMQLNQPGVNWRSQGLTANTSIGQGYVLVTPLQMASVTATVANGGKSFVPHLLKRVMHGDKLVKENPPQLSGDLLANGITAQKVELVRKGMWNVIQGDAGTARGAQIEGLELAGKTGTAQAWRMDADRNKIKDNNTWFILFGPYEKPKFAICALVQGGYRGGKCAAPIARRVLEQSMALDQGYQVAIAPVKEVKGNFNLVDQVVFPDSGPLLVAGGDDDADTGNAGGGIEQVQTDSTEARVDDSMIRKRSARRAPARPKSSVQSRPAPSPQPQQPPERQNIFQRLFRSR